MATPQMMALDQALAEVEVPQPDPGRWAEQLAGCHERVLAIMRAGGLPDRLSVAGLYLLWIIVNGFSLEETQTGRPERIGPDLAPAVSDYFAALPGDRFPNLVAVAGEFAKTDLDERFEQLIAIFIAGLTEQAGRS